MSSREQDEKQQENDQPPKQNDIQQDDTKNDVSDQSVNDAAKNNINIINDPHKPINIQLTNMNGKVNSSDMTHASSSKSIEDAIALTIREDKIQNAIDDSKDFIEDDEDPKDDQDIKNDNKDPDEYPYTNYNLDKQTNNNKESCCKCNVKVFRQTMAIILYFIFDFCYLADMISMLLLFTPIIENERRNSTGSSACNCDDVTGIIECRDCWMCEWTDSDECIFFSSNATIAYKWFPILISYSMIGWFLIEITVIIRLFMLCCVFRKERINNRKYNEKKDDEFALSNNNNLKSNSRINVTRVTRRQETIIEYQSDEYDQDIIGLLPCCFVDIDRYHMKSLLLMLDKNDKELWIRDQNQKVYSIGGEKCYQRLCCQCPMFMFGFSISLGLLMPFRYFWFTVSNLHSKFWKRLCWFAVFHAILFDGCWILFCKIALNALKEAKAKAIDMYLDGVDLHLNRKIKTSFAMIVAIFIVWATIAIYNVLTYKTKKKKKYQRDNQAKKPKYLKIDTNSEHDVN